MSNPDRAARAGHFPLSHRNTQQGVSLVELLVGLTIGLLVIAAAIGTLVVSRGAASAVSDISQLQQQGAFALRVIGLQLRQAGAIELVESASTPGAYGFNDPVEATVGGVNGAAGAPDTLIVRYQPATLATQRRDCQGDTIPASATTVPATFAVNGDSELVCAGFKNRAHPVIGNVDDFQVAYRVNTGTTDMPAFKRLTANQMTTTEHWKRVKAIEVCLDLKGSDPLPDGGGTFTDCKGANVALGGRAHLVFRNVFDVRKDSILEAPL